MRPQPTPATILLLLLLLALPAHAEKGSVSDEGLIDLTVKFLYPPPQQDIDDLEEMLAEASVILCDATEGGMRLGNVKLVGGSSVGTEDADVWVLNKNGSASATICWQGENVPCFALPIKGNHVNLPRNQISKPSTMAHELGHLVLDLGDEYPKNSCAGTVGGTIQKGVCQECSDDPEQTCLMHAEYCGGSTDYSELCTEVNHDLVSGQGAPCADAGDVFPAICDADTSCYYDQPYDPYGATPYDRCEAFNLQSCFYERSGQTWWSLLKFGEELDCWSHADMTHPAILDEVMNLPEVDPPNECNIAPVIDVQLDEPDQLVFVLDRSGSMAYQPGNDELCPQSGCVEICGNGVSDDDDGIADEDDPEGCVEPRIEFLREAAKASLGLFIDWFDDSSFEAGIVSFNCETTPDVPLHDLSYDNYNNLFEPEIDGLQPNAGTAIADGLEAGADLLNGNGTKAIFLVTDGFENCGEGCAADAIETLEGQGIDVYWTSFGPAIGSATEACYASKAQGNWINPATARELVPAFAQQLAEYLNAGVLIPQLHYDLSRGGTFEDPSSARTPQSWLNGDDESTTCPASLPCLNNAFEVPVEPGTSRLAVVLGGDMTAMAGFGVRAVLSGPAGSNPSAFDSDTAGPDPYMKVERSEFYMTVSIFDPNPGTWRIELSIPNSPDVADTQTGNISVISRNDDLHFFTSLDRGLVENPAEPVGLRAVPSLGGELDHATVQVMVYRPDGSSVFVPTNDLSDFDANYFAEIDDIPFAGVYQVRVLLRTDPVVTTIDQGEHYEGELPEVMAPFLERTAVKYFVATSGIKVCNSSAPGDCDGDGIVGESTTTDTDADGLPDDCDLDADGDDIADFDENSTPPDLDGDGVPDYLDSDADDDGVTDFEDPGLVVGQAHNVARLLRFDVDTCGNSRTTFAYLSSDQDIQGFDLFIDWAPASLLDLLSIGLGPDVSPADVLSLTTLIEESGLGPGEARATLVLHPGATLGPGNNLRALELTFEAPAGSVAGSEVSLCFDPGTAAPLTTVTVAQPGGGNSDVTPGILCGAVSLVGDTSPPWVSCPGDATIELDSICTATWNDPAVVGDNCDPGPAVSVTPPLPISFVAPGTAGVVYTATDVDGNAAACATTLTAEDASPPLGGIVAPPGGSCHAGPVTLLDDFLDNCDAGGLSRTYEPAGPTYTSHGDYDVDVSASDRSGNTALDSVTFSIDLVPPTLVTHPGSETLPIPSSTPFASLFSADDLDGAAGDVIAERVFLDSCPAFDGSTFGDGDGLLSDEILVFDLAAACEARASCGFAELDQHTLLAEAEDCAGHDASDTLAISITPALGPRPCQVEVSMSRLPHTEVVNWTPVFEADAYDVVRGLVENLGAPAGAVDLGPLTCVAPGTSATSVEDGAVPAPGSAFFYVVRYVHGPTTSEYGWSSADGQRIPGPGDCVP